MSRAIFPRLCPCLLGKPIGTHQWLFLYFNSSWNPLSFCKSRSIFPFKYQDLSRAMSGRTVRLYTVLPTPAKYWSLWNLKRFALFYFVLDLRSKRSSSKNTVFQLLCFAASEENCEARELEPNRASIGKWHANGWSLQSLGSRESHDDVLSRKQWEGLPTAPSTQY